MSLSQDEISLLQNSNEKETGSYGEDKTVARRRIEKVAKSVSNRFGGRMVYISRPF